MDDAIAVLDDDESLAEPELDVDFDFDVLAAVDASYAEPWNEMCAELAWDPSPVAETLPLPDAVPLPPELDDEDDVDLSLAVVVPSSPTTLEEPCVAEA